MMTGQPQKRWTRVASQRVCDKGEIPHARPTHPGSQRAKKNDSPHVWQCSLEGRGQFRRCQSRLPLGVLALRSLAAMLELTLYLSLVVRRWCRAFLFDPLSMGGRTLRRTCASLLIFCASSKSGVRIRYLTRVRTGPPFGWVSPVFHISRNGPTSDAEMRCLRNWFSHSTSISASPVTPGFSVTRLQTPT